MVADLPWNSVCPPAALRASSRSAANAASVSGEVVARMTAAASSPGTRSSAAATPASVSRSSVVVNCANCSARNTDHSRSGAIRRVATTARHIGHVPCMWSRGSTENGMPRRRKER